MTSPRRSLARDVQWVSEMPISTPQNPFPTAKEMRISSRIWGIPMTRSMIPPMTASVTLPRQAAMVPMMKAATALKHAVKSPMRMLMDKPVRLRMNISRPIQSVPKG